MKLSVYNLEGNIRSFTIQTNSLPIASFSEEEGRISCGSNHILLIIQDQVYTFGDNSDSQLGQNNIEDDFCFEPKLAYNISAPIVRVGGGRTHSVAIDSNGKIWTWGGDYIVRGRQGSSAKPMKITRGIDDTVFINSISCGANHTLAIDREGRLFAWGKNDSGQLGLPLTDVFQSKPKLVDLHEGVYAMQTACGNSHSLILTSDLRVFSTGKSPANGLDMNYSSFTPIELLCLLREKDPILMIQCGESHSLACSNTKLFSFGDGSLGKLGLGNSEEDCFTPTEVLDLEKSFDQNDESKRPRFRRLSAGAYHSLILLDQNNLVVFGLKSILDPIVLNVAKSQPSKRAPKTMILPEMYCDPVLLRRETQHESIVNLASGSSFIVMITSTMVEEKIEIPEDVAKIMTQKKELLPPFPSNISKIVLIDDQYKIALLSKLLFESQEENKMLKKELEKEKIAATSWREFISRKDTNENFVHEMLESLNSGDSQTSANLTHILGAMEQMRGKILELEAEIIRMKHHQ